MSGKKYSISAKSRTGINNLGITVIVLVVLIATLVAVITSAATFTYPTLGRTYTQPIDTSLFVPNADDLKYLEERIRAQANLTFYSNLVQCEEIALLVLTAASEQQIRDVEVLFALMWLESRFDPRAINNNGTSIDRGLFQLNSRVYAQYPEQQFFDIAWNIRTGVQHYATELAIVEGQHRYALHAYNAGRARRFNPPAHTRAYAERILRFAQDLRVQKRNYIEKTVTQHLARYIE